NNPLGKWDYLGLSAVLPPDHPGSDFTICDNLFNRIMARFGEVVERRRDLLIDHLEFYKKNPHRYNTHQKQMANTQANLKKLLQKWDDSDCGGKTQHVLEPRVRFAA